jgi:hypothetical protein
MVSQHTANVPSARARLGSIPRLSATIFGCQADTGWPRLPVKQSAPLERPGSNPGAPTKSTWRGLQAAASSLNSMLVSNFYHHTSVETSLDAAAGRPRHREAP